jgi:hypothetical protein
MRALRKGEGGGVGDSSCFRGGGGGGLRMPAYMQHSSVKTLRNTVRMCIGANIFVLYYTATVIFNVQYFHKASI